MSEGRSWRGDWKARVRERLRGQGHSSLTAFAEARPTLALTDLARELGDDINAAQVFSELVVEAERGQWLTRLVRGQFVRELSQSLPEGWPSVMDDASRFKIAKALGLWSTFTPETHQERVDRASDALLAAPPPAGWRPVGHDDALLLSLLPDEEG